jgi:hypothetical protein
LGLSEGVKGTLVFVEVGKALGFGGVVGGDGWLVKVGGGEVVSVGEVVSRKRWSSSLAWGSWTEGVLHRRECRGAGCHLCGRVGGGRRGIGNR